MNRKDKILKLMANQPKPDPHKEKGWAACTIDNHFGWFDSKENKCWPTHELLLELEREGYLTRYSPGEKKGFKLKKQKAVA